MKPRIRNRLSMVASLFVASLLLLGCQTSPESDSPQEELAAFEQRVLDEYLVFEQAQEPNEENEYTSREYYAHLFDPEHNPRALALGWLEGFEVQHRGTQPGLDALTTALEYLATLDFRQALVREKTPGYYELLVEHYTQFESLGTVCYLGNLFEDHAEFLMTMDLFIAKSPHRTVQARAIAAKMRVLGDFDELELQGDCAARLLESYSEVLYQNTPCGELAEQCRLPSLDEAELEIGATAPEITGYDIDGRPVALRDLRGQVVVMSFFGYWCISCRELTPGQQALAEELQGQPVTFLWLMSDVSREYVRTRLELDGVEWPHIFMPWGVRSPLTWQWRIGEWPTIFVLDREGVIRFRGNEVTLRRKNLEKAVRSLLDS